MTDETRQKLRDAGRHDLIETYDLISSGYAGINQLGAIVDRREFPKAVPIKKNSMFNAPDPKPI